MNWFGKSKPDEIPETDSDRSAYGNRACIRAAQQAFIDAWQSVRHYVATHPHLSPQFYLHNGGIYRPGQCQQRADVELNDWKSRSNKHLPARNELLRGAAS